MQHTAHAKKTGHASNIADAYATMYISQIFPFFQFVHASESCKTTIPSVRAVIRIPLLFLSTEVDSEMAVTKTKKLYEVIAIEKGVKQRNYQEIEKLHKLIQKPDFFNGHSRTFKALNDEGERYPDESKKVQSLVQEVLRQAADYSKQILDTEATKDRTNCVAMADIVLEDGTVLASGVPATTLLYLEKSLTDWRTLVQQLPVLDPAEDWEFDSNSELYKTGVTVTHKTSKIEEPLVLIQPTKEHPGQAKTITKDVITGHWHTTKMSGAVPADTKSALWRRANQLIDAVKAARERANSTEVVELKIGEPLFNFLLG